MTRPLVINCEDYGWRSSLVAYGWLLKVCFEIYITWKKYVKITHDPLKGRILRLQNKHKGFYKNPKMINKNFASF
jgi:hypothetical protein